MRTLRSPMGIKTPLASLPVSRRPEASSTVLLDVTVLTDPKGLQKPWFSLNYEYDAPYHGNMSLASLTNSVHYIPRFEES